MIIVSQDKKSIYNFDNAKSIDILENEIYITDNILADEGVLIGVYETEERADEVKKDIVKCYANTEQYKCLCNINNIQTETLNDLLENAFIYGMPES